MLQGQRNAAIHKESRQGAFSACLSAGTVFSLPAQSKSVLAEGPARFFVRWIWIRRFSGDGAAPTR